MPLPSATLSPSTYRYMYPSLPSTATMAYSRPVMNLDTGSSMAMTAIFELPPADAEGEAWNVSTSSWTLIWNSSPSPLPMWNRHAPLSGARMN